jgi:hypothetical protein
MTPQKMLLLRQMSMTVMRARMVNEKVKSILAERLILSKKKIDATLQRRVNFSNGQVRIEDTITNMTGHPFKWLEYGHKFSSIHMASSKYFQQSMLNRNNAIEIDGKVLKDRVIDNKATIRFPK